MNPTPMRLKRTPPERSGPIRNPMAPPRNAPANGATNGSGTGPTVLGALENGVRTAYAVIDDYMRRGQEAAQALYNDSNRRGYMSDNRGNYGGGGFNPFGPLSMLTEQWMMAMRAWTEAWSAFMPGFAPQMQQMQQMWNPAGYGAEASACKVSVQVASARPAEVTANLRPGSEYVALMPDPLTGEGAGVAPLRDVTITRQQGRVVVSVRVAADQPAGRYSGAIRKAADGSPAGDLTVVISGSL